MSLSTNVADLATAVATAVKQTRVWVNGNAADLSALTTTNKTSLVAAINEVQSEVGGAAGIDDSTTSTSSTWSSTKTAAEITAARDALIDAAPGTLDTLNELAAALGDDPNFAATVTAELGNRVRFDAAQTLTAGQQTQARANIGAASAAEVGDTTTNFVNIFNAGLA